MAMAKKKATKKGNARKKTANKRGALGQWVSAALGIVASMLLLAVAVALGMRFFAERPQDLYEHSTVLKNEVSEALTELGVPSGNIRVADPEHRESGRTRWLHYDITATVPAQIRHEGLADSLGRRLLALGIGAEVQESRNDRMELALQFGDYPFARLRLEGDRPPPVTVRDIRDEAYALAGDVQEVLEGLTDLVSTVEALGAVESSDAQFRWATTRLEALFANDGAPALVAERLREAVQGPASTGVTMTRERSGVVLRVYLYGKTAVEIHALERTPVLVPSSPPRETMPESRDVSRTAEEAMEEAQTTPPPRPGAPLTEVTPLPPPLEELPLNSPAEGEIIPEPEAEPAATRLPPRPPSPTGRPRLALILDDGGYGGNHTERVLAMDPRLTLAILPNTPFGTETARRGKELGFEIMLHMPMETGNGATTFPGEIQTTMDRETIRELTLDAIAQIPGLTGANNHTGSKYTANSEKMAEFLEVIREHGLYFVDSVTRGDTVAWRVAREMGLPTTRRDLFIDHDMNEAMIRQRFEELIEMAKQRGSAVGIGHFRPLTVEVLETLLPRLEEEGVELVHASELLQ